MLFGEQTVRSNLSKGITSMAIRAFQKRKFSSPLGPTINIQQLRLAIGLPRLENG